MTPVADTTHLRDVSITGGRGNGLNDGMHQADGLFCARCPTGLAGTHRRWVSVQPGHILARLASLGCNEPQLEYLLRRIAIGQPANIRGVSVQRGAVPLSAARRMAAWAAKSHEQAPNQDTSRKDAATRSFQCQDLRTGQVPVETSYLRQSGVCRQRSETDPAALGSAPVHGLRLCHKITALTFY